MPKYILDAVGSSGILKGKQKLNRLTFSSDKLGSIDLKKNKTDHEQCLGGSLDIDFLKILYVCKV